MEVKGRPPLEGLGGVRMPQLLRAYLEATQLKRLYRQGWLRRGLERERCESVADHSFGVALLALLVADSLFPRLDRDKLLRMALVHDLGEVHAGDITPGDGVAAEDKHGLEADSVRRVLGGLPGADAYLALWEEYAAGSSAEARLLRQLDRLEMGLQALVYERDGLGAVSEFYESAREALESPALGELLAAAEALGDA